MAEDVARVLGASAGTLMIGDVECKVRPLTIIELTELERTCLKMYKREYLSTYSDNADLLPDGAGERLLREKMDEVSLWTLEDLPTKEVYDVSKIKINGSISKWLTDSFDYTPVKNASKEKVKRQKQEIIATCLESEDLSVELYTKLTDDVPRKHKVGYSSWWITGSHAGQLEMICKCFEGNPVTRSDIILAVSKNPQLMIELSRTIESLSAPEMGNT